MFSRNFIFGSVLTLIAFAFPQAGFGQWWPGEGTDVDPNFPWNYSPGFHLVLIQSNAALGEVPGFPVGFFQPVTPAPKLTYGCLNPVNGQCPCTDPIDVTITGRLVCFATNKAGGIIQGSEARCDVAITILGASAEQTAGFCSVTKVQLANQATNLVYKPGSKVTILASQDGLTPDAAGYLGCPSNVMDGKLVKDCVYPVGTEQLSNGQLPKAFPAEGNFPVGGILIADQKTQFTQHRGCKGIANGADSTIDCLSGSTVLTGGGESNVTVKCTVNWAGSDGKKIQSTGGTQPVDFTPLEANCNPSNIVRTPLTSAPTINGVAPSSCTLQTGRLRCFYESALVAASCTKKNAPLLLVASGLVTINRDGVPTNVPLTGQDNVTCQ